MEFEDEVKELKNQGWEVNPSDVEYPKNEYDYISIGFLLFRRLKKSTM